MFEWMDSEFIAELVRQGVSVDWITNNVFPPPDKLEHVDIHDARKQLQIDKEAKGRKEREEARIRCP